MLTGGNKDLRKKIRGYELQASEHHRKIAAELAKPQPDYGRIRYWERELRGFEATLVRLSPG
jgi:molybdate-binding protein